MAGIIADDNPRIADIHTPFVRLTGYGRVNEATAVAVVKAMARAVARGRYGLRLVPCRVVGWRREATRDDALPPELRIWAKRVLDADLFYKFAPNDLRMVRDWILSTKERDPRLYAKIPRMDWQAIKMHAERRHARIAKAAVRTIGKAATPGHVVLRLDDGWTWHLLDTPELLDGEGASMGHCVGFGGYDEDCLIFSLRDAGGISHVTAEFVVEADGRLHLGQYAGPRNAWDVSVHNDAIRRLIARIGAWEPSRSIP